MKTTLIRTLAALAACFTFATSAQALSITPRAATVEVAPGGTGVAEFDIDFGGEPLAFYAFALDLNFDVTQLASNVDSVLLTFSGTEPQFSLGSFERANHDGGSSIAWIIGMEPTLPSVSGTALLRVPFADLGVAALTPLQAHVLLFTADDLELYQNATVNVVTSAVPEPQSWALALAGGMLLIAVRRRLS